MSPTWLHWPSTWSPSDLTSLRAWYKADALSLSNTDPVSTWSDSSGNGYDLTQTSTARPTFKTATLNGLPVVDFDGTDDVMAAATASDWTFLHDSTGSTVLAVWKAGTSSNPGGGSATQYGLLSTQSSLAGTNRGCSVTYRNNVASTPGVTDSVGHFITNGGAWNAINTSGSNAHSANAATIVAVVGDPATSTFANRSRVQVNSGSAINNNSNNGAASSNAPSAALHVGATGSNNLLEGFIAEVVICDSILSNADREKLEGYLAHKWGLESNLPSTHPYKNSAP